MAYHPLTPGIIAGNVARITLNASSIGSGAIITPAYVKNNSTWNGIKGLDLTIVIPAGTTLVASSTQTYALQISGFDPNRQRVTIKNAGNIFGKGGAGGAAAAGGGCQTSNPGAGGNGTTGGSALFLANRVKLENTGVIGGGGGGSGGDGATQGTGVQYYQCAQQYSGCPFATGWYFCAGGCGGCSQDRGGCGKNQRTCQGYTNSWYTTTCSRTVTQWCPNSSGAAGTNGSGGTGSNGTAYSTGAGGGAGPGYSIVGVGFLTQESTIGTLLGGTI